MDCQCWLPDGALLDGVLETRFLNLSLAWARKWFAADTRLRVDVAMDKIPRRGAEQTGGFWSTPKGDAIVNLSAAGEEVIARAMLGIPMGKGRPNAADRQLFTGMAAGGMRDFCARLEEIFPGELSFTRGDAPVDQRGRCFSVTVSIGASSDVLHLTCTPGLAVSVRKSLVAAGSVSRACGSFSEAIGSQIIRVGARLGTSSLRLAEFDTLAPGDIILLDRTVDEPVELTIEDVPAGSRYAMLEPSDGGVKLRFREAAHV